jgi:HEAT repeat protein
MAISTRIVWILFVLQFHTLLVPAIFGIQCSSAEVSSVSSKDQEINDFIIALDDQTIPDIDRYEIIHKLSLFGIDAVDPLLEKLKDANHFFRWNILLTLGAIGPEATEASPFLIQIVKNNDEELDMRSHALDTLVAIGVDPRVVPEVRTAVKENPVLCLKANYHVEINDMCLQYFIRVLKKKDEEIENRLEAAWRLTRCGATGIDALVKVLREDPELQPLVLYHLRANPELVEDIFSRVYEIDRVKDSLERKVNGATDEQEDVRSGD